MDHALNVQQDIALTILMQVVVRIRVQFKIVIYVINKAIVLNVKDISIWLIAHVQISVILQTVNGVS